MNATGPSTAPRFVDAQKMHRLHPRTFLVPDKKVLNEIQAGDLVKVAIDGQYAERFWVEVTGALGKKVWGTCGNVLVFADQHSIDFGDVLRFEKRHCYDVILQSKTDATSEDIPTTYPVDKSGELKWAVNRSHLGIDLSFDLEEEAWPSFSFQHEATFRLFQKHLGKLALEDQRLRTAREYQLMLRADERGAHLHIRRWDHPEECDSDDIVFPSLRSFLAFQRVFRKYRLPNRGSGPAGPVPACHEG